MPSHLLLFALLAVGLVLFSARVSRGAQVDNGPRVQIQSVVARLPEATRAFIELAVRISNEGDETAQLVRVTVSREGGPEELSVSVGTMPAAARERVTFDIPPELTGVELTIGVWAGSTLMDQTRTVLPAQPTTIPTTTSPPPTATATNTSTPAPTVTATSTRTPPPRPTATRAPEEIIRSGPDSASDAVAQLVAVVLLIFAGLLCLGSLTAFALGVYKLWQQIRRRTSAKSNHVTVYLYCMKCGKERMLGAALCPHCGMKHSS